MAGTSFVCLDLSWVSLIFECFLLYCLFGFVGFRVADAFSFALSFSFSVLVVVLGLCLGPVVVSSSAV